MTAAVADRPIATRMSESKAPEWERRSELTLAALPSAVNAARLLVCRSLADGPYDEEFAPRVERAVDELVIHAVATTGVIEPGPLYGDASDRLQLLVVRLRLFPERAMVEVWDRSTEPPHPRLAESHAVATAEDWGYDLQPPHKRVVWCAVSTLPDAPVPSLPRRVPRPIPRRGETVPARTAHDTDVLRRVLDGLRQLGPDETGER